MLLTSVRQWHSDDSSIDGNGINAKGIDADGMARNAKGIDANGMARGAGRRSTPHRPHCRLGLEFLCTATKIFKISTKTLCGGVA